MLDEKANYYMNRNVKLSPSIIALTWDVIFVWTISTMFFTNVKGLSYSQVILLDSILMLFGCVLCVPLNKLIEKIPSVLSAQIGTLGYAGYILLCMFGSSFPVFIFAQFFLAFAYSINSVNVNSILTDSLNVLKRDKDYQRVFGKGLSLFYAMEAIGAIVITYVYNWNPYAAYACSLIMVIIGELVLIFVKEPSKFQEKNVEFDAIVKKEAKTQKKTKTDNGSYKRILSSVFFITLLLFMFFMRGTLSIAGSSFKIYLQQLIDAGKFPIWLFGYVYAGIKLSNVISNRFQFKFDLKFGVKSLLILGITTVVSFVAIGLIYLFVPVSIWSIVAIILCFYIQGMLYSPSRIFANNYMQVCMQKRDMDKAYSIRTSVEYLGYAIVSSLYAALLTAFSDNIGYVNLVYIGILSIPILVTMILFIKQICKKYAQKYTIIKSEYVDD